MYCFLQIILHYHKTWVYSKKDSIFQFTEFCEIQTKAYQSIILAVLKILNAVMLWESIWKGNFKLWECYEKWPRSENFPSNHFCMHWMQRRNCISQIYHSLNGTNPDPVKKCCQLLWRHAFSDFFWVKDNNSFELIIIWTQIGNFSW